MSFLVRMPSRRLTEAVGPLDGVEYVVGEVPEGRAGQVEVLVSSYARSASVAEEVAASPGLQFLQLQSAGYDGIPELLPPGVTLANAKGVHDDATAELAVGLSIASLRGIPEAVRQHGTWTQMGLRRSLADSRTLILGYGSIGRAIAERLLAHRAVVTAVASRPRADDLVGEIHGVDALVDLLPHQDVVIIVLPHSAATHHLVDRAFLARLPDGALVVNVGRGACVDTEAVVAEAGRLRFALDVTDPEPLPDGHPLWSAPDVLITPHIAGGTSAMLPRIADLVRDQLIRYRDGQELRNVVG